jgi:cytochrome c5
MNARLRLVGHSVSILGVLALTALAAAAGAQVPERSGKEVVDLVCAACHANGLNGAPKIGDRAAWTPRLNKGLDPLVSSAIHGHGGMPARGGVASLTDPEVRAAILYMFNHGVAIAQAAPATAATAPDPHHKIVGSTEIYLGLMPAQAIRAAQAEGKPLSGLQGKVPSGTGYYHVNITLADSKTKAPITDAQVKIKVADAIGAETKTLDVITANNTISYGNYFHMSSGNTYAITAMISRPGTPDAIEAGFGFKAP